jgi:HTH-type transcriptional regulator/antitoxin HigA|eukprot:gene28136-34948_t
MEAMMDREAVAEITSHYKALSSLVPLQVIRNQAEYDQAVSSLNGLLDAGAANENHPLADLVHTLGLLIGDYDDEHFAPGPVSPIDVLRLLMEQHGLSQSDLAEVGTQGVVSEILNGKRELNIRQIKALAARFHVPPGVFIA